VNLWGEVRVTRNTHTNKIFQYFPKKLHYIKKVGFFFLEEIGINNKFSGVPNNPA